MEIADDVEQNFVAAAIFALLLLLLATHIPDQRDEQHVSTFL